METILDFAWFMLQALLWYAVFSFVINFFIIRKQSDKKQLEDRIVLLEKFIHIVQLEQHSNIFYWYDSHNGQFLTQGKTLDEAAANLRSRFGGHIFLLNNNQSKYKISEATNWQLQPYSDTRL